jgi:transcriptional regulator with GAF, ATPase, and Fis domain
VTGETGTGKELVARGLHQASPRAFRPLVAVNCASLTPSLCESELFGSTRGAFTGADRDRAGVVGEARGGTLFLDEIGELPLAVQPKLLRLLESGLYRSVGGGRERPADVRIIAATNRDLQEEVEEGAFRADLYYRINVLHIHLLPLRSRREDIPLLVESFLAREGAAHRSVEPTALEELMAWGWPGNARELAHVLARALVQRADGPLGNFELAGAGMPAADGTRDLPAATSASRKPRIATSRHEFVRRQRVEILRHLDDNGWNVSAAARALGWTRGALRSRMRRLGLEA